MQQLPLTHHTKVNFTSSLSEVPAVTMPGTPSGLAPLRDVTAAVGPNSALFFPVFPRGAAVLLWWCAEPNSQLLWPKKKTPKILHDEEALAPEIWNIWFASNKASSDFLQYQDGFGCSWSCCGHYRSPTHPCFSLQSFLPYVSRDNRPISRSNYRAA